MLKVVATFLVVILAHSSQCKSVIKLKDLILEKNFQDLYGKKNKWIEWMKRKELAQLKKELFVLINNSYGPIGGHVRVSSVDKVLDPALTYWEAVDLDVDPDADAVIFGKKTRGGIKISGMGHDGTSRSKSDLMNMFSKQLTKSGYWVESSGRFADVMYGKGVPYVKDPKVIEKLFGTKVEWLNDKGRYRRKIDNALRSDVETVFGTPR